MHTIAFTGSARSGSRSSAPPPRCRAGPAPPQARRRRDGRQERVIVDSDADLDEVVPALVASAFVFAGQKCSAAARVLAHEAIHDALVERLAGAVEVLQVGQAERPRHRRAAGDRARGAGARRALRRRGRAERPDRRAGARGARRTAGSRRPTLAADLPADSPVLNEEIFGPLLAVERVRDVEAACDRVDALPVRAHRRACSPATRDTVELVVARVAGRQPLRQPLDHRRDGRPPAVRRQPPLRHRHQGRRPGLPAPVRRAARGDREHDAPRPRGLKDCPSGPARAGTVALVKEHAGRNASRRATRSERAPAAAAPAAAILALQRSAGNAAVTRMLARAPGDAPIMLRASTPRYTPGSAQPALASARSPWRCRWRSTATSTTTPPTSSSG